MAGGNRRARVGTLRGSGLVVVWSPSMPLALLDSKCAPTTAVSPEFATLYPN